MCAYVNAYKFIIDNNLDQSLLLEDDASIIDEGMQYFLLNIDRYLHLADYFMIHSHISFATTAQIISLNGAKTLYSQKDFMMYGLKELIDTAIWNNKIQGLNWNYTDNVGLPPVFYQKEEFNTSQYSLRCQINEIL